MPFNQTLYVWVTRVQAPVSLRTLCQFMESWAEGKRKQALLGVITQSLKGCGKTTELTGGERRRAMQMQCRLVCGETCRAMHHHSILCLKGSTWRKGNFVEPVPIQLERWDFTLHQPHDSQMFSLCVSLCGCVGKTRGEEREQSEKASDKLRCQTSRGKMQAWILEDVNKIVSQ